MCPILPAFPAFRRAFHSSPGPPVLVKIAGLPRITKVSVSYGEAAGFQKLNKNGDTPMAQRLEYRGNSHENRMKMGYPHDKHGHLLSVWLGKASGIRGNGTKR